MRLGNTQWISVFIILNSLLLGTAATRAEDQVNTVSRLSNRGSTDTETVRRRYAQLFTGGDFDKNDPDVKAWMRENDAMVLEVWNSMDREGKQTYVWKDCRDSWVGGLLAFGRLADMANVYACSGSEYYKNEKLTKDIISGLEVLIKYWSLPEERGNWWHHQIGIPNKIDKCLVLMWDELSPELRQKYLKSLKVHGPHMAGDLFSSEHGKYPGDGTLTARKSWFMFDDEVVALGSGISASDGVVVETVVENRRLTNSGKVSLVTNREKQAFATETQSLSGVNWLHLDVGTGGAETGYYFPETANLKVLREKRTGNWADNYGNFAVKWKTPCVEEYLAFWFDHGVDPRQATYAYVLLPGKSVADVKAYAEHPRIEIIENSPEAQAIRHPALKITGVNFWNDAVKKVSFITVDKKASVMVREANGRIDVAISDPTQFNKDVIYLELEHAAEKVISSDACVEVLQLRPTIKLSVKVNGLWGATARISLGH